MYEGRLLSGVMSGGLVSLLRILRSLVAIVWTWVIRISVTGCSLEGGIGLRIIKISINVFKIEDNEIIISFQLAIKLTTN